jgi:hypothetical protein
VGNLQEIEAVHRARWRNMWAIKYGAGILPTRNSLVIRGHDSDTASPWSNEDTETTEHISNAPTKR